MRRIGTVAGAGHGRGARSAELGWWVAAGLAALVSALLLIDGLRVDGPMLPSGGPLGGPLEAGPAHGAAMEAAIVDALTFDADVLADMNAYRGPRRALALVSRLVGIGVPLALGLLLLRGADGDRLRAPLRALLRAPQRLRGLPLQVGGAAMLIVLTTAVVRLPVAVGAGIVQDGRWGFRTRSVPGWMLDHLLVVSARAVALGLLATAVMLLVARHPRTWPARVSVLVAVIGPLALLVHPLVVHPLLLPSGQLPDGAHRDAVVEVAARSGLDVPVLLGEASLRTTRRNAVVTGLGPTQRIVLHDTLLELDPREVAAITAHELAHVERRDPLRGVLAPVPLVLVVGLLVRRRLATATDLRTAAAAVALVLAAEAMLLPMSAAVSRTIEHRTDVRSVALSGDAEAHVAMLRSFVIDGLSDPGPPRWSVLLWATHPPPAQRIRSVLSAGPSAGPSAGLSAAGDLSPMTSTPSPSISSDLHATR